MTPDPIDELQLARSEREMYRKGCELFKLRIRELEKERDDVRRQVCELLSNGSIDDTIREAEARGWDSWNEDNTSSSDLHQAIRDLRIDAEKIGGFDPERWTFKDPFCAKVHEVLIDVSVKLISLQETIDDLTAELKEKPEQP